MKIIKHSMIYLIIFVLAILASCDVIEPPYEEGKTNITERPDKNVLIEDFTGFRCGNCPEAAEEATRIHEEHGDRVVIMAIHEGDLAKPTTQHPYDFRTDVGTAIDNYYNLTAIGTPIGMLNRREFEGVSYFFHNEWSQRAEEILKEKADVSIDMAAEYNESSSVISIETGLTFFEPVEARHKFNIFIVEDSIVQFQKYYGHDPVDIEDYVHNHVLRDGVYGAWGTSVNEFAVGEEEDVTINCSYVIPSDTDWRWKKLHLIGVVMDENNEFEVLQAEQIPLYQE